MPIQKDQPAPRARAAAPSRATPRPARPSPLVQDSPPEADGILAPRLAIVQGGADLARAQNLTVTQGGIREAHAERIDVKQGGLVVAQTNELTLNQGGIVRVLFDWRAGLAFGAALALGLTLLHRVRGR